MGVVTYHIRYFMLLELIKVIIIQIGTADIKSVEKLIFDYNVKW